MQHFQPIDMSARKPKIYVDVCTIYSVDDSRHSRHENQDLAIDISKFVCNEEENLIYKYQDLPVDTFKSLEIHMYTPFSLS